MTNRPKIGISACLLGNAVRFDGGHKRDRFLTDTLAQFIEWVPICPEVEVGMTRPRDPVRLSASRAGTQMIAERSGKNWTDEMVKFARTRARNLATADLSGYIFKKNSPTCVSNECEFTTPKECRVVKVAGCSRRRSSTGSRSCPRKKKDV